MSDDSELSTADSFGAPREGHTPNLGELPAAQSATAIAWFKKHTVSGCGTCGRKSFMIAGLVHAMPWASGALPLGGGAIPLLLIVCENCARTQTFSAVLMGIVGPDGQLIERVER